MKVKLLHKDAKAPVRGSELSAGADIFASEALWLHSGCTTLVPTGLTVKPEDGCYIRVAPRSSYALRDIHAVAGVVDADYRGEVKVALFNASPHDIPLKKGSKIAQLIEEKIAIAPIEVVEDLDETVRGDGGFGSTGE